MPKMQIMLVEDDRIIASHIKSSLVGMGYDVCCSFASGEEAIDKAGEHHPDLVLMDIELEGEMDGIEAAGQIRAQFNIPVVFLTAFSDKKILDRVKKTEPYGYIIKPFEDRELQSIVEIALYMHSLELKLKTNEERLRQQNDFLNRVVNSLTHPFYVIDANDYSIQLANSAAKAGNRSQKLTCHELTHQRKTPCGGTEHPCPLAEVKKTKKPCAEEHVHYINNEPRDFEVNGFPILDKKGNVVQMIEYSIDITDRKKAE